MYAYNRILVGLDLTDMDKVVIQYVNHLCEIFDVNKIYFFHVAKSFELPTGLLEKYPDLIAPIDETITQQLKTSIERYYTSDVDHVIEVKEGNPTDKILKWSEFKEIDLVVMGKKKNLKGHGILPEKLVKTGHCSILFVPEVAKPSISKILLPLDFSKNGKMILDVGVMMQKQLNCQVVFHHSFQVPTGYNKLGKTYEEFADIMRIHAQNDMERFIDNCGIVEDKMKIDLTLDNDDDPSKEINNIALIENVDFIIIGSKGRSGIASILVGSVAQRICKLEHDFPVLVVKNKHENMGFIDAILKI